MLNLHPKVKWGALYAALSTAAIAVLAAFGVDVPQGVAAAVATIVYLVAGYFKSA